MHLTTHFGSYWHFTLIEISTYICTIEHLFTLFFHSETFGELAQDSVSFQSFSIRKFEIGSNSKKKNSTRKKTYSAYFGKYKCICFGPLVYDDNSLARSEWNNTTTRCKCRESKRRAWRKNRWRTTRTNSCFVCKWNTWISPLYRSEKGLKRRVLLSTRKCLRAHSHSCSNLLRDI